MEIMFTFLFCFTEPALLLSFRFVRVGEDQMPEPEGPSATPETTIISENRTEKKRKKDEIES